MPGEKETRGQGLSLKELLYASASSAAAFLIVPLFWKEGTLFATAMTPVIVAVVRELLARPVERAQAVGSKLSAAAPSLSLPSRRSGEGAARAAEEPPAVGADPFGLRSPERRRTLRRRAVRLGLVTGVIAFVGVAAFMTVSELAVFGKSFGGADKPTLVPSSSSSGTDADDQEQDSDEEATPTPTGSEEEEATPTPEATETPAEETPTPEPGATPGETPEPAPTPTVAPAVPEAPAPTPAP